MPARLLTFAAALATAAVIVGLALLLGHQKATDDAPVPVAVPTSAPDAGSWAAAAAALPVIDRSATPPAYARESFGERWADIDGNGCLQRDDVLARDLVDVVRDNCTVVSGTLRDPYAGGRIPFASDSVASADDDEKRRVRIDHIVGLRAAHDGGAWEWTPERRTAFANSLENLLAVDSASAVSRKGNGPARWLPSDEAFVCDYAIRYTWIATAWQLAVSPGDRDALTTTLVDCDR